VVLKWGLIVDIEYIKPIVERAEAQARLKAINIHKNDPSGKKRTEQEIISQNFLGALADIVCAEIIKDYFNKHNVKADVIRYDDIRTDCFKEHDEFDIKVIAKDYEKIIEVRSSVCIYLSDNEMIRRWQILGPYISEAKKDTETDKAFYMRLLYHLTTYKDNRTTKAYKRSNGIMYIKNKQLKIYFVGGSTIELLNSKGRDEEGEELKQGKSMFRVLDIKDGFDANNFLVALAKDIGKHNNEGIK
jgi:hypothetical protein